MTGSSSGDDIFEVWSLTAYPNRSMAKDFLQSSHFEIPRCSGRENRCCSLVCRERADLRSFPYAHGLRVESVTWSAP